MCIASWSMPACLNHLQNTGHKFPNMMLPMCKCVLHVYYLQQWLKSLPMVLSMMHTSMYHTPRAAIFSPNPISSHHCMFFCCQSSRTHPLMSLILACTTLALSLIPLNWPAILPGKHAKSINIHMHASTATQVLPSKCIK